MTLWSQIVDWLQVFQASFLHSLRKFALRLALVEVLISRIQSSRLRIKQIRLFERISERGVFALDWRSRRIIWDGHVSRVGSSQVCLRLCVTHQVWGSIHAIPKQTPLLFRLLQLSSELFCGLRFLEIFPFLHVMIRLVVWGKEVWIFLFDVHWCNFLPPFNAIGEHSFQHIYLLFDFLRSRTVCDISSRFWIYISYVTNLWIVDSFVKWSVFGKKLSQIGRFQIYWVNLRGPMSRNNLSVSSWATIYRFAKEWRFVGLVSF